MTQDESEDRAQLPSAVPEEAEVGRRIRRARLERELTLKELGASAQLSATHLSDIERGRTSPTMGALMRIAEALEHEPRHFVERDDRSAVLHLPVEACRTFSPAAGIAVEILTVGIPGSRMIAYRLRFEPQVRQELELSSQDIKAEGIALVWRGVIESDFGQGMLSLGAGDATQATFTRPHRLRSAGDDPAEMILVATRPVDFTPRI